MNDWTAGFDIQCKRCGASIGTYAHQDRAVDAWNRRITVAVEPPDLIEETLLKTACDAVAMSDGDLYAMASVIDDNLSISIYPRDFMFD